MELDQLIEELNNADNLTEEQLTEIEKKLNPYGATIFGDEKYTCLSFTNLREQYLTKLLTTALVGFTYQMAKEHETDIEPELPESEFSVTTKHPDADNENLKKQVHEQKLNELNMQNPDEDNELTTAEYVKDFFKDKVTVDKQALDIAVEQEKKKLSNEESVVITRFLNKLFKFDPNVHSSNSYKGSQNDPERTECNAKDESLKTNVPAETFHRFQTYYDVNYEQLRAATCYLYSEKPDIEVAVNVYDSFDTLKECNEYVEKNKDKVITSVLTVTNNKWNLIGSFKENRDRVNFYNKNTVILENIIKQREEDAKLGKELLSKRVRKVKAKNVKRYGKDHPNFVKYKKNNLDGIYDTTITKITEEDDEIVVEHEVEVATTGAAIDEDGVPEDSLEIGVTTINAKTNETKKSVVYTKAEAPKAQ
jgi:hypothetical protein